MTTLAVTLQLASSPQGDLQRFLLNQLARQVQQALQQAMPRVRADLALEITRRIQADATTLALTLVGGQLRGELGVVESNQAVNQIIQGVVTDVQETIEPVQVRGDTLTGGFSLGVFKSDLSGVLSLPLAQYITAKGEAIPWLRWLLSEGVGPLVSQYRFRQIRPGATWASSRTGQGVMIPRGTWSVPGEFAGTVQSNWLTRAIGDLAEFLDQAVTRRLREVLG